RRVDLQVEVGQAPSQRQRARPAILPQGAQLDRLPRVPVARDGDRAGVGHPELHDQAVTTRFRYEGGPWRGSSRGWGGAGGAVESHAECDEPGARKPLVGLAQRAPAPELQSYPWSHEYLQVSAARHGRGVRGGEARQSPERYHRPAALEGGARTRVGEPAIGKVSRLDAHLDGRGCQAAVGPPP